MPPVPRTVADVMSTALVTLRDTDFVHVADTELQLGALRHLPVVDRQGHLVGVLSARDVLAALARARRKRVRVGEVMSRAPISVGPETAVWRAIDLLLEQHFGCLPVVADDGRPVGLLTETDVLRAARELFAPPRAA